MIVLKLYISSISAHGKWKLICAGVLSLMYICIAVEDPSIKRGGGWDPIIIWHGLFFVFSGLL